MSRNPFRPFDGPPSYQEEFRGSYKPTFIDTKFGPRIVSPDTPYVAAAGRNLLYFLDTRFDERTALHIKTQIEAAYIPRPEEHIFIDEFKATAERRTAATKETVFTFDPVYARVLFAEGINKRNAEIKLPEYELGGGDWLVKYIFDDGSSTKGA